MSTMTNQFSKISNENLTDEETRLIHFLNGMEDEPELFDYLIAATVALPIFPEEKRKKEYQVNGCQANIWVYAKIENGCADLRIACDSLLIKGVLALLVGLLSKRNYKEILNYHMRFVRETDIQYLLSEDRRSGMEKVLVKIKQDIEKQLICENSSK